MYTVMTSVIVAVSASELIAVSLLPRQKSNPHSSNVARVPASNSTINKALGQLAAGAGRGSAGEVFRNWTATGKPWTGRRSAAPARQLLVEVIERQDDDDRRGRDQRCGCEELRGLKAVGERAQEVAHPAKPGEHLDHQNAEQAEHDAKAHPGEHRGHD